MSSASPLTTDPIEATAPEAARLDWALFLRQIQGIARLELRRFVLSRRIIVPLLLAFAPVALVSVWALSPAPGKLMSGPMEAIPIFATSFGGYLRTSLYLSCLIVFSNLFRAEILEKSLHYYYLTPVRREVIVAGKYLSALAVLSTLFAAGTALFYLVTMSAWGPSAVSRFLFQGPGLGHLVTYMSVSVLACFGYGAVFLLIGQIFRNPVVPGLLLWGWEFLNPFLPVLLKKISVVFYLQALLPIQPSESSFSIMADPTSPWISVPGLLIFTSCVLLFTGWRARNMEITYGGDD